MSSKASKRRGRPIVVDGTRYYWKICVEHDLPVVYVLLPTGRRVRALYGEVTGKYGLTREAITPGAVATFIRRVIQL